MYNVRYIPVLLSNGTSAVNYNAKNLQNSHLKLSYLRFCALSNTHVIVDLLKVPLKSRCYVKYTLRAGMTASRMYAIPKIGTPRIGRPSRNRYHIQVHFWYIVKYKFKLILVYLTRSDDFIIHSKKLSRMMALSASGILKTSCRTFQCFITVFLNCTAAK